jgi:sigma-B regulation protein RsbU (phosphoserine phosphatase)
MTIFSSSRSNKVGPPLPVEGATAEFPVITGAQIATAYYEKRVGGDFYDCFRANLERIIFGLLDVAGRREDNQQVLASARTMFRTLGVQLFAEPDVNESEAMEELCLRLNLEILKVAGGVRSCPAFIGCYHEKLGTLCYINAGHTPGFLIDRSGPADLAATGLPLGLFSHATYDSPIAGIETGAAVLLVSRGVVEGRCKKKKAEEQEFGLERLREYLRSEPHTSAQSLCSSVLKTVSAYTCEPSNQDDMTAMALVRSA